MTGGLWHGTQQGLVIFCASGSLHAFFVPRCLPSRVIVGNRFFLKPLIACLTRIRQYYVLAISDKAVRLLHCRGAESTEVHSEKLPASLEAAVSSRNFSRGLQGHTSKASGRKVLTYHGHSAPVEQIHENRRMYRHQIDTTVRQLIGQSSEPLVLACVKELFAEFQQIHTYPHLVNEPIIGNRDRLSPSELHKTAQQILGSETRKQVVQAAAECKELQDTDQASVDAEAIIEAALQGRVGTVFIADDAEMWGTVHRATGATKVAIGDPNPEREELLNLVAIQTVTHGGIAYALPLASMPSSKPAAALFRY